MTPTNPTPEQERIYVCLSCGRANQDKPLRERAPVREYIPAPTPEQDGPPEVEGWTLWRCPRCGWMQAAIIDQPCQNCGKGNDREDWIKVEVTPLSALQAERQRREDVEQRARRILDAKDKWIARAEQAEKERDEARAELERARYNADPETRRGEA